MKFAEKYEILEMVTSGRVSTFLARERASQEAVVVYTFECTGTGAGDLSTASIISRFCALAPNPPGIIVKAGFDEPSSSAFITTKMPEPVALKAWVGAYQGFAKPSAAPVGSGQSFPEQPGARAASNPATDATAELSAEEVRAVLARSGPAPKPPPVENLSESLGGETVAFSLNIPSTQSPAGSQPAGEFTRLFREANAFEPVQNVRPPAPKPAGSPTDATDAIFGELLGGSPLGAKPGTLSAPPATSKPAAGSFTREFLGVTSEKPAQPRQAATPVPPAFSPSTQKENEPGAFTREFMAVSPDAFKNAETSIAPPAGNSAPAFPALSPSSRPAAETASFDSIFGGPSSSPSSPTGGLENQKSGAGEFTSFFRDPFESPGAPQKPITVPDVASSSPTKAPVGDFTRMFGRDDVAGAQNAPPPVMEAERQPSGGSFTQMFGAAPPPTKETPGSKLGAGTIGTSPGARPTFSEPSVFEPVRTPAPPVSPRMNTPPPIEPLFSPTSAAPAANSMFMRGSGSTTDVFRVPGGDVPPIEQGSGGPSEFTVFLSRSQVNAAMSPEPPASSAPPPSANPFQFAPPPPPPAVKMPAVPKAPAFGMPAVPPPKPGSIWPLVVVLTVLVAIGALLVMYFALKH